MRYVLTSCNDNIEIKEARLEVDAMVEGVDVTFSFNQPRLCEIRFHTEWSFHITYFYFVPSDASEVGRWSFYGHLQEDVTELCQAAEAKLAELAVRYEKELTVVGRTNVFLKRQYLLWELQNRVASLELEITALQEQGPILTLE